MCSGRMSLHSPDLSSGISSFLSCVKGLLVILVDFPYTFRGYFGKANALPPNFGARSRTQHFCGCLVYTVHLEEAGCVIPNHCNFTLVL